ncbi:hypothetical protein K435DRAFT_834684 [Dendrothele bispora CBS 962.96]|uniref:Uncharacterized protein n=1 Tax=Dendrothele bispora (strain CBS 962.96) TaxID=1314807 RepID=A0A4S8MR58_DENBC|nr:hypothetical protein K435DRAFT_834684 [Dendrothele bispora CBS 962.96]
MAISTSPVLIVGAGPSGLALALTLLRNNIPVRIIEKQSKYQIGQRGSGIQCRTIEVYKFLGILPEILEASGPASSLKVEQWAPGGKEPERIVEMVSFVEDTPSRPYNNTLMLGQDRHEHILRSVLERDYGCNVELATELVSFEQHADHVEARISKTIDGKEISETTTFAYLIGADGARSVVRKQSGLTFLGESIPSVSMVTGDIDIKGIDKKYWRTWGGPSANGGPTVSLRPCETDDDRFNFTFMGSDEANEKVLSGGRDAVIQTIKEITGKTELQFGELIWLGLWRPNIRMVNKSGEGRVFVAGDAAHVHSPTGGQGMNSGVQDSFNLGWKLSLVYKGLAPHSLLDSYSDERLPVIATMLNKTTELFHKTFGSQGRDGWVRGYELRQFGVNYRGSPIVIDQKYTEVEETSDPYRSGDDGSVRAGDRAPDAPGLVKLSSSAEVSKDKDALTFFDMFKPSSHTVIVFAGERPAEEVDAILATTTAYSKGSIQTAVVHPRNSTTTSTTISSPANYVLLDRDGHAYKGYVVSESEISVVVVRPDGYIGALVFQPEGLKSYFSKIFA